MNGYKLLETAVRLTGMTDLDDNIKIIGLSIVNSALEDLGLCGISSLSEPVGTPSSAHRQALIFGSAMLICNALGDGEGASAFSALYNQKLSSLKCRTDRIRDTLPKGEFI